MSKLALTLGGGGARGAYQIGALKALLELNIKFDIITSTSVGCLNALLIAQNQFDKLIELWSDVTFENIMNHKYRFKNKSLETLFIAPIFNGFSIEPLENLLNKYIDEELARSSDIKMGIIITENYNKYKSYTIEEIPQGELSNYILTSCSAWPFLKRRKINGKTCYDGYYSDNLPIKLAQEMGASKVIAIDVLKGFSKKVNDIDVYYLKLKSKFFFLNFEKNVIKELMELGYKDVMGQKEEIVKFVYSK